MEADKETAILNKEELQSRVSELEQHLEQTQDKLQVRQSTKLDVSTLWMYIFISESYHHSSYWLIHAFHVWNICYV